MNQFKPTYGNITAIDWENAAVPAHTAPAAFHRDWLVSACGNVPARCKLAFVASFANLVVFDCHQNPAARMEKMHTLSCKKS
jgi:hypothetical protein